MNDYRQGRCIAEVQNSEIVGLGALRQSMKMSSFTARSTRRRAGERERNKHHVRILLQ